MNQKQFFEENKELTEEIVIVLRKQECHRLADKLLLAMGRMEGVIKFHGMLSEVEKTQERAVAYKPEVGRIEMSPSELAEKL